MSTTILQAPRLRLPAPAGAAPLSRRSGAAWIWSWPLRWHRDSAADRAIRAAGVLHRAGRPPAARTIPLDPATNPVGFCVRHAAELPVWAGDRLERAYGSAR
jgi:hypothetical protein